MLRPLRITLEIIAALVGVIIVLGLLLIWRLNAGPIRSVVLTPYLEAGIEGIVPGTDVQIAHTVMTWDNDNHSVALHAEGLQVTEKNGAVIAEVPTLDIQLSAIGVMFGQFLPIELMIDHPQIKLERRASGSIYFGGMTAKEGESSTDIKDSLARIARHLAHAYFTHKLHIDHATFKVHDTATNTDWSVHIPEIALDRTGNDLSGRLAIDVTQKNQVSTLDVRYNYDRSKALHRFVTHFSAITPAFFAGGHPATLGLAPAALLNLPLSGDLTLAFDSDMDVASGNVQLHGDTGFLDSQDLWDKPRFVKSLDIKADYDREEGHLDIPSATIDFGGPRLNVSVAGKSGMHLLRRADTNMNLALSVQIDNWPMDQYAKLWPKPIIPDAREWIAANMSKGRFDHGEGAFRAKLDLAHPDDMTFTEGKGKLTASGGDVKYVDGMPPVEGVSASADFDLDQMKVQISGGGIGDIRLMPFTVTLSGFEDKVQNIDIPLKVTGPVPSILRLIDNPPLGYAKAIGLKPDDITGRAAATVTFRFPLLKTLEMKDMDVRAEAALSNVASSRLVKDIDITQGNLALTLDPKGFEVKGPATLNKVPLQIAWKQNFGEVKGQNYREAMLTGGVTDEQWQALGIGVFNGTHGPIDVALEIIQPDKNTMKFSGTLDMTAADTKIEQLNWKKPPGVPATMRFAAEKTGDGENIDIKSIDARGPQMNIKGNAVLSAKDGRLVALNLNPMVVGRTDAALHFSGPAEGKDPLRFNAEGKAFDVSGLKGGRDPERTDPRPKEYHIEVAKLFTSENGFINSAKGYAIRDGEGWSEISLHGLADGSHPLSIELVKKTDGTRGFVLTCDDFGKALKGMGFTDTVRDGKLDIHGESDPDNPRVILGEAEIGHFTVGHLPVLAVLMNAASPFGFAGLFSGSMDFDNLKGKFRWEGDGVKLIALHAAGASVGINASGRIDMNSSEADLHGTMVPFSVVNSILNEIPLVGELITGGKGQGFFAVSYSINGPLGDPHIGVNPVSLLTPGFLRNLFFGESDEDETPAKPAEH